MQFSSPLSAPLFLVRVTDKDGTGLSATYSFREQWSLSGVVSEKIGGRYADLATNPAYSQIVELEEADYALARRADGEGGLAWELFPLSAGGGAAPLDATLFSSANWAPTADNTWTGTTGTSVANAGNYIAVIAVTVLAAVSSGAPGVIRARLYNHTAGGEYSSTTTIVTVPVTGGAHYLNLSISDSLLGVAAGDSIGLQILRASGSTWTTAQIDKGRGWFIKV